MEHSPVAPAVALPGPVLVEPVLDLPGWLLAGVALGLVLSALVVAAFLVGRKLYGDDGPVPVEQRGVRGEERRRREIRRYLEAIGEDYREDATVAGRRVAFYLPEREVAITFDARDFFDLREAGVTTVLSEHELPGASIGHRLPFETPTFGRRAGDAAAGTALGDVGRSGRSVSAARGRRSSHRRRRERRERRRRAALAVLGLPPDANEAAVADAYRRRIKEVHPDHGGDQEQFRRVREAYEVAREAPPGDRADGDGARPSSGAVGDGP